MRPTTSTRSSLVSPGGTSRPSELAGRRKPTRRFRFGPLGWRPHWHFYLLVRLAGTGVPRGVGLRPRPESWFGARAGCPRPPVQAVSGSSRCAGVSRSVFASSAGRSSRGVSWVSSLFDLGTPEGHPHQEPLERVRQKRTPTFRGPPNRLPPDLAPYMGTVGGGGHCLCHKPAGRSPPRRPKFRRHRNDTVSGETSVTDRRVCARHAPLQDIGITPRSERHWHDDPRRTVASMGGCDALSPTDRRLRDTPRAAPAVFVAATCVRGARPGTSRGGGRSGRSRSELRCVTSWSRELCATRAVGHERRGGGR